jgi:hypothetical protein
MLGPILRLQHVCRRVFHDMRVAFFVSICLFISPDLDGSMSHLSATPYGTGAITFLAPFVPGFGP